MRPIDRILRAKRAEIEHHRKAGDLDTLRKRADNSPPTRDFRGALHATERISLIAEIKKSSPSRGKIADIDVADLARQYDRSAASAVSVLTDSHFEGKIEHLAEVKIVTSKPVLRKDFILDKYQIYQSRAGGADAVLLIASILEKDLLAELLGVCRETGLHAIIESHTEDDLAKIPQDTEIYGINNRDLNSADLIIDMETTPRLVPLIPKKKTIVCESGIFERADIERIAALKRVNAVLIGTSIITSGDPAAKIAELLGIKDYVRTD